MAARRPRSYRDPRKPPKGDRGGRDHGEPVVYRGHQVAGDYKANWERYQAGLGLVGGIQRPQAGGYQQPSDRSNVGYWSQGIVSLYCPDETESYGQILHFDAAAATWLIHIQDAIASVTAWLWTAEPSCSISGGDMVPVGSAGVDMDGTASLGLDISPSAANYSFSVGGGYGVTWIYLKVLSVQPSTKTLILQRKP